MWTQLFVLLLSRSSIICKYSLQNFAVTTHLIVSPTNKRLRGLRTWLVLQRCQFEWARGWRNTATLRWACGRSGVIRIKDIEALVWFAFILKILEILRGVFWTQISKIKLLLKIINGWKQWTIFLKSLIVDVYQGSE